MKVSGSIPTLLASRPVAGNAEQMEAKIVEQCRYLTVALENPTFSIRARETFPIFIPGAELSALRMAAWCKAFKKWQCSLSMVEVLRLENTVVTWSEIE